MLPPSLPASRRHSGHGSHRRPGRRRSRQDTRASTGRRPGLQPLILIGGHYHYSPLGRPSFGDIIAGTDVPSVEH